MLTKETILSKCKVNSLSEVKTISMWGCDIEDISIISQLSNITVVSLSVNKIKSLSSFSSCLHLRELYLRKNLISSLSEIDHLTLCKSLSILWLEENPICQESNYSSYIIHQLPQISKLDNEIIKNKFPTLSHNPSSENTKVKTGMIKLRRATSYVSGERETKMNANHMYNESFVKFNRIDYGGGDNNKTSGNNEKKSISASHSSNNTNEPLKKKIKLKIKTQIRVKNAVIPIPRFITVNNKSLINSIINKPNEIPVTQTTENTSNEHIVKAIVNLLEKMSINELKLVKNEIDSLLQKRVDEV